MKKLTMFLFAALIATTAGATCIQFDDFCDALEVTIDDEDSSVIYGYWTNWNCGGSDEAAVGSLHAGLGTFVAGDVLGDGDPYGFQVTPTGGSTCAFDLYQRTSRTEVTFYQTESPCTITPGSCSNLHLREGALPSLLGEAR